MARDSYVGSVEAAGMAALSARQGKSNVEITIIP
jgi:hypothetical protein